MDSVESTQGYQDSDFSPMKINISKRKRKLHVATHKKQYGRITRRYSYPSLVHELMTSDSNTSSYFVPVRRSHSTTNSEVYRTDSYQLLMPKPKFPINKLEPIDEANQYVERHFRSVSKDNSDKSSELNILVEIGSSGSVSLPLSPELSVVERLSISREVINNNRLINKQLTNESLDEMDFNEYMISEVDMSLPLMKQQCNPKNTQKSTVNKNTLTDTFMHRVGSVHLEELTLSETLDQRLRDLLLESSKKKGNENDNAMEVELTNVNSEKKQKAKKRCSTPHKKKTVLKTKTLKDTIIEEHVETCSFGGKKSCPPDIMLHPVADVNAKQNRKSGKTKDVIKVKIQRPKKKLLLQNNSPNISVENISTISTCTVTGINDADIEISGVLKATEDSVDLIHNHSETCLHANECINSVEFVENSKSSITSVNSSHPSLDSDLQRLLEETKKELFGSVEKKLNTEPSKTPSTTYHSPIASNSSLLTEDLSDEIPAAISKPTWYLLSEDETNTQSNLVGFGTNLKELFPIVCAVPDLSTISEMSKENDNSRKPHSDPGVDNETQDLLNMF